MSHHATGPFEMKLLPQMSTNAADPPVGRMTIDKQFHGELEAISKGEMLSFATSVKGSAGYVAIEQVTGKLAGHAGTFALQHSGTMDRGVPKLSISVIPDSGTGELAGLSGTMNVRIEPDGKHFYDFDYALLGKE